MGCQHTNVVEAPEGLECKDCGAPVVKPNSQIVCAFCDEPGHPARSCPALLAMSQGKKFTRRSK